MQFPSQCRDFNLGHSTIRSATVGQQEIPCRCFDVKKLLCCLSKRQALYTLQASLTTNEAASKLFIYINRFPCYIAVSNVAAGCIVFRLELFFFLHEQSASFIKPHQCHHQESQAGWFRGAIGDQSQRRVELMSDPFHIIIIIWYILEDNNVSDSVYTQCPIFFFLQIL